MTDEFTVAWEDGTDWEIRIKGAGCVEAVRRYLREVPAVVDLRARFGLPDDADLLTSGVSLDRREGDHVLTAEAISTELVRWQAGPVRARDHPHAPAGTYESAFLRCAEERSGVDYRHRSTEPTGWTSSCATTSTKRSGVRHRRPGNTCRVQARTGV